jgi:predicted molibdopterin-dependent oxidoreductase YjgC
MRDLRIPSISRGKKVEVFVNGLKIAAYEGETVLAALTAAGRRKLRRSLHHAGYRGAFCGMGICYECLVTINGRPRQHACMTEVEDHMEIHVDDPEEM